MYIVYICIWYISLPLFLNFLGLICYFIYIYFLFLERGCREWSGGAGAWRPEGVRDLSAVTVLHDHKQWLVG
jgi:hypothetical protein